MKTFFIGFSYASTPIEEVKADYFRIVDGIALFYNSTISNPHTALKAWATVAETLPTKRRR
jgi:hypothetical protein